MLDILSAAAARLHARGIDQWPERFEHAKLAPEAENGRAFFVLAHTEPIATFILSDIADPDFWTPSEAEDPAMYVSKLASLSGHPGIGAAALDWCSCWASRLEATLLRLDAWRTNPQLQQYYLDQGFDLIRTVEVSHRNSGALFERPTRNEITSAMKAFQLTPHLARRP